MKNDVTLSVPTPCSEKWERFTPTTKGRFCGSCQKEVIDFTHWGETEIKNYFLNKPSSVCGRFKANQLKTYHHPSDVTKSRYAPLIAFFLMLLTRPSEAQLQKRNAEQEQLDTIRNANQLAHLPLSSILVRGVVRDSTDGTAMPGVTILRKGTTIGTVSDADGRFELRINRPKETETLTLSFIGYGQHEKTISTKLPVQEIEIALNVDLIALGETVIVGGMVATRKLSPRRLWWRIKSIFN